MLCIKISKRESVKIGDDIEIAFTNYKGMKVNTRLLIKAPKCVKINRIPTFVIEKEVAKDGD